MRITHDRLRRIISEELSRTLKEQSDMGPPGLEFEEEGVVLPEPVETGPMLHQGDAQAFYDEHLNLDFNPSCAAGSNLNREELTASTLNPMDTVYDQTSTYWPRMPTYMIQTDLEGNRIGPTPTEQSRRDAEYQELIRQGEVKHRAALKQINDDVARRRVGWIDEFFERTAPDYSGVEILDDEPESCFKRSSSWEQASAAWNELKASLPRA